MYKELKALIAGLALVGWVGTTNAAPVLFTYTGEITAVSGTSLPGLISIGDVATINVITDNGSSSLISQTWDVLDTISATFSAGGYSLTHSDGWFTSSTATGFSTDGTGNLVSTNWFGIGSDPTAFDTFGLGGDLNNGSGSASNGDSFGYAPPLATVNAWTGPELISDVPEPGMLTLIGLSLAGLGLSRRRRMKA